ncbi:glycosyl hydrolase family 8 [Sinorhizobium sp. BJ1]|uniref:glycosyl hydrolase family 8 n=1 Tax=Sinorhizobium sp. BJ1 TaxID=2035455 RepID=UPI000BE95A19|nr:glycosyl hydrolase family 8 [Sinorhizobium sp. BJ1]PDT81433.1 endoglucanase [Sinorhizobium sp. BJ1]
MRYLLIFALLVVVLVKPVEADERRASVKADAWAEYKSKFLDSSGRILDDANGNVSHSEGQGYGLLLSFLANEPADFEQIWSFTRRELLLRDDGLAAWKWSPDVDPHVTDVNNATDGDILIAYGLALAAERWSRSDYSQAAVTIAKAILDKTVIDHGGRTLLLPGVVGFSASDRDDGPVINPSYWVFEALPVLDRVVPSPKWRALGADGKAMIQAMKFGPQDMPADWVSAKTTLKPAAGFPREFGFNALRIPLYVMRAEQADRELLLRLQRGMSGPDGELVTRDLETGAVRATLTDPGYRFINHILACVLEGTKVPEDAKAFHPTQYYPSTLHLLGLSFVEEKHPECL